MKFGIFIFGDNHPELGRSNQKCCERQRLFAGGTSTVRHVDGGGQRIVLGRQRDHPEGLPRKRIYLPWQTRPLRQYFAFHATAAKAHAADLARRPGSNIPQLDNIMQERLALFTTPEDTVAILREYKKIGVTHVIGMVNFGGVPITGVRRTMELMSARVFPKLQ